MDGALRRATELYSEIREVKLFNAYRYLHHTCLEGTDLEAALEMKMNYIRMTQGRMNRIGHNYESAVEWFVDRFTTSAQFLTQNHREAMDPRRITIHLLKPVGRRRNNAELDRVWTVKPNAFGQPITYALECKFGLVDKSDIDDLLEVLKWSTEFGYDAPDGRRIKNGVVGVFAGSVFNPKERVQYRDGKVVNLATYAARMNIELYKTAEFNSLLHNRGVEKTVTIQKICRASRNEAEVRTILTKMWDKPEEAETIIGEVLQQNKDVYALEEELEEKGSKHPSQTGPSASPDPSPEPYRRELAVPVL
ncbi:MAG: hypothetical protein HY619_04695 [Thaumarchaeota archaeon]|nr:hypothetical protein [Nitrososphaerota archaeon]